MPNDDGSNSGTVSAAAARLRSMNARTVETAIQTGEALSQIQNKTRRGFPAWVVANTPFSLATAERFIRIFRAFGQAGRVRNIDLDALYLITGPGTSSEAVEYAAQLSKSQRVTTADVKDILFAHRAPPSLLASGASLSRIPEANLCVQADRGLNAALKAGASVYLTHVPAAADDDDAGDYTIGKLIGADGRARESVGSCAAHAIIGLTGEFPKKECGSCGATKNIIEFGRSNESRDGYEHRCRACMATKSRVRWQRKRAKDSAAKRLPQAIPATD